MNKVNSGNEIRVDTLKNLIIIKGEPNLLSKNECLLIRYFYERQGITISRDELIQQCWPGRVVSPTSLPVAIKHIRDILKKAGYNEVIKTHKGEGYSLLPGILEIDFIEGGAENKPEDFRKTRKNTRNLLYSRQALSFITIGLSMFSGVFLGLTICTNNIKHWRTDNGALIISSSKMTSQVAEYTSYQEGSVFIDDMGSALICNKFKCYFSQ
ncbi:TPA: winged helix-turn-helix domain-containing protein [Escherichia coli]|uniref:winged helix-turn-helix domain-containing protein n=1 Tax=Escherichia coli TaxID=562 RepID=UPI001BD9FD4C|nr:winged helix-turn-helix domain-containing protein [Escherichia coli]